jgi:hypothetical protein
METRKFAERELVEVVVVKIVEEGANLLGTLAELNASPSLKLAHPTNRNVIKREDYATSATK